MDNILNLKEIQNKKSNILDLYDDILISICTYLSSSIKCKLTCSRLYNLARRYIPEHIKLRGELHFKWMNYNYEKSIKMNECMNYIDKINKYVEYRDRTRLQKFVRRNIIDSVTFTYFGIPPTYIINRPGDIKYMSFIHCDNMLITNIYNLEILDVIGDGSIIYTNILRKLHTLNIKDAAINDISLVPNLTSLNIKYIWYDIDVSSLIHLKELKFKSENGIKLGDHPNLELLSIKNRSDNNLPIFFNHGMLPSVKTLKLDIMVPSNISYIPNVEILKIKYFYDSHLFDISYFKKLRELYIVRVDTVIGIEELLYLQKLSIVWPYNIVRTGFLEKIKSLQHLEILNDEYRFIDDYPNINISHIESLESLTINACVGFGKLNTNIKKLKIIKKSDLTPYLFLMYDFPNLEELIIINYDEDKYHQIEIDLLCYLNLRVLNIVGLVKIFNDHLLRDIDSVNILE